MKKAAVSFLIINLVFVMAACQGSKADNDDAPAAANAVDERDEAIANDEQSDKDAAGDADTEARQGTNGDGSDDESEPASPSDQGRDASGSKQEPNKRSDQSTQDSKDDSKQLTKQEAEQLVREHLELTNNPGVKVDYDHDEGGRYVIHVYEIVGDGEMAHTATWGWYYVDPQTKKIESMF